MSLQYTPLLEHTPGSALPTFQGLGQHTDLLRWQNSLENHLTNKQVRLCDLVGRLHYLLDNLPLEVPAPGEFCSSRAHQVWAYEVYLLQAEIRRRIQRGLRG